MSHSVLIGSAIANIKKDLLSQPLQLLSGLDILGNASSALGHMSKGVAALSMDKKFIQSRQKQVHQRLTFLPTLPFFSFLSFLCEFCKRCMEFYISNGNIVPKDILPLGNIVQKKVEGIREYCN